MTNAQRVNEMDDTQEGPAHNRPCIAIDVCDVQSHVALDPHQVRGWCRHVLEAEGVTAARLSVTLVDDAAIRRVNRDYLAHDWPTDVVSFSLADDDDNTLTGELVVSCETAARVARDLGHDARTEVALYVVHGALHLCGFDDQNADAAVGMRERQAAHVEALGLGPLAEVEYRVRGGEPCPT